MTKPGFQSDELLDDIELNEDQEQALAAAIIEDGEANGQGNSLISKDYRWPEKVLRYEFGPKVKNFDKIEIRDTLKDLQSKLDNCIKFEESSVGNRVLVQKS